MGNLFEIVFEDFNIETIDSCVKMFSQNGKGVSDFSISSDLEDDIKIDFGLNSNIKTVLEKMDGGAIVINIYEVKLDTIIIPNCSIRIVNYDSTYDIEFNFELEDLTKVDNQLLFNEVRNYSKVIASKFGIENYYAGYEPACDEDNRVFTNNEIGPLKM